MRTWTTWLLMVAALFAGGCNLLPGLTSPSDSTSSSSSSTTFSGSLSPQGAPVFFTFTAGAGPVAVTLTAVNPPTTSGIGLGLGTPTGTTACTLTNFTTSAVAASTPQISANEAAGGYCVQVYDPGSLTGSLTFTLSVAHS
jgi:hypothetical protein